MGEISMNYAAVDAVCCRMQEIIDALEAENQMLESCIHSISYNNSKDPFPENTEAIISSIRAEIDENNRQIDALNSLIQDIQNFKSSVQQTDEELANMMDALGKIPRPSYFPGMPMAVYEEQLKEYRSKTDKIIALMADDKLEELKEDSAYVLWDNYRSFMLLTREFRMKTVQNILLGQLSPNAPLGMLIYPYYKNVIGITKPAVDSWKRGIIDFVQNTGKWIYDKKIPGISDYIGEITKVRGEGAESNVFTILGSFAYGAGVNGGWKTIEGVVDFLVDPYGTIEGISKLVTISPSEISTIAKDIQSYVDTRLVNGTAEDRAELAGQLVFEIAALLIGIGGAKAGVSTAKGAATYTDDVAKLADKADDAVDAAKLARKAGNAVEGGGDGNYSDHNNT